MGAKKPQFCPNFPITLINTDGDERNRLLLPRCKMWTCAYCAELNRRMWRRHLITKLNTTPLNALNWSFTTFTLPEHIHAMPTEHDRLFGSIQFMRLQWDKTIKSLKRQYGQFEYFRVIEAHKSKALHIHGLFSFQMPDAIERKKFHQSPTFSKICENYEWGFVDNRNLKGDTSATVNYAIKYCQKVSKNFHQAVSGARLRRVQTSRKIGSPKNQDSPTEWQPRYFITPHDMEIAQDYGKYWWFENAQRVITDDDFADRNHFPPMRD